MMKKRTCLDFPPHFSALRPAAEKVVQRWSPSGTMRVLKDLPGLSGAAVMVILFPNGEAESPPEDPVPAGRYVLKLIPSTTTADPAREERGLQLAKDGNPAFAQDHLPMLIRSGEVHRHGKQTWHALLYQLVGGRMNDVVQLDDCQPYVSQNTCLRIAEELLNVWFEGELADGQQAPRETMSQWVGSLLDGPRGEVLRGLSSAEFNGGPTLPGAKLIDPLWLWDQSRLMSEPTFPIYRGRIHGDLHSGNVLASTRHPRETSYWLIDFASMRKAPFGYDHANLELSLLIRKIRGGVHPLLHVLRAQWDKFNRDVREDNAWLADLLRSLRQAESTWQHQVDVDMGESIEAQFILARIAAGLSWASKSWEDQEQQRIYRRLAWYYAAWWSHQYVRQMAPDVYNELVYGAHAHALTTSAVQPVTVSGDLPPAQHDLQEAGDDLWNDLLLSADQFEAASTKFILVADRLEGDNLAGLGQLPWSMILDLDPVSAESGLHKHVMRVLENQRGVHVFGSDMDWANFRRGTAWMMAAGSVLQYEEAPSYDDWRYDYLPKIETLVKQFRDAISLEPVRVVLLCEASAPAEVRDRLEKIVDRIDMAFRGDQQAVKILQVGGALPIQHKLVKQFPLSVDQFCSRVADMYGTETFNAVPHIPGANGPRPIPVNTLRLLEEDMEVVHSRLLDSSAAQPREESPFWRGHPPTWQDIHQGLDVQREIQPDLVRQLNLAFGGSRNTRVELHHMPGTGGTTLALRTAWEFRRKYPVAVLRAFHRNRTVANVDMLFRLAEKRPVLLVAESTVLSPDERDLLLRTLSAKNCRCVLLYVQRTLPSAKNWHAEDEAAQPDLPRLDDEVELNTDEENVVQGARAIVRLKERMSLHEAKLFRDEYFRFVDDEKRRHALDEITYAKSQEMRRYRVPFFYGLIAFEREYRPIQEYVAAHFESAGRGEETTIRPIMNFLALVTRFSTCGIPRLALNKLLQLSPGQNWPLEQVLGTGPAHLAIQENQEVRLMHPVIAEEVLQDAIQTASRHKLPRDAWMNIVGSQAVSFIQLLKGCGLTDEEQVVSMLQQLFVHRGLQYEDVEGDGKPRAPYFAEIILLADSKDPHRTMSDKTKGQQLLQLLVTECADEEGHFHHHLGRYFAYAKQQYKEAIDLLTTAIIRSPQDRLHRNSRGNIYRRWIKYRIESTKYASPEELLQNNEDLFERANEDFRKTREAAWDDERGYFLNILMITNIALGLVRATGGRAVWNAYQKSAAISYWLDQWLFEAESLYDEVRRLLTREELQNSDQLRYCDEQLIRVYGDLDDAIRFGEIVVRSGGRSPFVNRRLVYSYLRRCNRDWSKLDAAELEHIHALMQENLSIGPLRDDDFRLWFQAYRRLKSYSSAEAIHQLKLWSQADRNEHRTNAGLAYYYLYVLYFVRWFNGEEESPQQMRKYLELSRKNPIGIRNRSLEWLTRTDLVGTASPGDALYSVIPEDDLGEWDRDRTRQFWKSEKSLAKLARINGRIVSPEGAQRGYVRVQHRDLLAFFVPGKDFEKYKDKDGMEVSFYLGFRFDELRAWKVSEELADEGMAITPQQRLVERLTLNKPAPVEAPPVDIERLAREKREEKTQMVLELIRDLVTARRQIGHPLYLADLQGVLLAYMRDEQLLRRLGYPSLEKFIDRQDEFMLRDNGEQLEVDFADSPDAKAGKRGTSGHRRNGRIHVLYDDFGFLSDIGQSAGSLWGGQLAPPEDRWFGKHSLIETRWDELVSGAIVSYEAAAGPNGEPRAEAIKLEEIPPAPAPPAEKRPAKAVAAAGAKAAKAAKPKKGSKSTTGGKVNLTAGQIYSFGSKGFGFISFGDNQEAYFKQEWFPPAEQPLVAEGAMVEFVHKTRKDGSHLASNPRLQESTEASRQDVAAHVRKLFKSSANGIVLSQLGELLREQFDPYPAFLTGSGALKKFVQKELQAEVQGMNVLHPKKQQPPAAKPATQPASGAVTYQAVQDFLREQAQQAGDDGISGQQIGHQLRARFPQVERVYVHLGFPKLRPLLDKLDNDNSDLRLEEFEHGVRLLAASSPAPAVAPPAVAETQPAAADVSLQDIIPLLMLHVPQAGPSGITGQNLGHLLRREYPHFRVHEQLGYGKLREMVDAITELQPELVHKDDEKHGWIVRARRESDPLLQEDFSQEMLGDEAAAVVELVEEATRRRPVSLAEFDRLIAEYAGGGQPVYQRHGYASLRAFLEDLPGVEIVTVDGSVNVQLDDTDVEAPLPESPIESHPQE